jgi:hypothetical protein
LPRSWQAPEGAKCDGRVRARLVVSSCAIAAKESGEPFPKEDVDRYLLFNMRTGWFRDYRLLSRATHPCTLCRIPKGILSILPWRFRHNRVGYRV